MKIFSTLTILLILSTPVLRAQSPQPTTLDPKTLGLDENETLRLENFQLKKHALDVDIQNIQKQIQDAYSKLNADAATYASEIVAKHKLKAQFDLNSYSFVAPVAPRVTPKPVVTPQPSVVKK